MRLFLCDLNGHCAMNCDFQQIGTECAKRIVSCDRCHRTLRTPYVAERVRADCPAWPRPWEVGHWVALWLDVFYLSKKRWAWLQWKLGLQEPGNCASCEEREMWLNTLGGRIATAWRTLWRHD